MDGHRSHEREAGLSSETGPLGGHQMLLGYEYGGRLGTGRCAALGLQVEKEHLLARVLNFNINYGPIHIPADENGESIPQEP